MAKYRFTFETKVIDGVTLHRIEAATDFYALAPYCDEDVDPDDFEFELIREGTLGGWLETRDNLSQEAFAWVAGEACVYGKARVSEGALIYGEAKICSDAEVRNCARVYGQARVHGGARICGHTMVYGHADVETGFISGEAKVYGGAKVCSRARVCGQARVHGGAQICGGAMVYGHADVETGFISGKAEIYDHAHLYGEGEIRVYDHAKIYGMAELYSGDGESIAVSDIAIIHGNAKIRGDGNKTRISDCTQISEDAKVGGGTMISGHATILGSAEIDGASIDENARICGDTVIPAGTLIKGNALVKLKRGEDGGGNIRLPTGLYLTGDTEITSSVDYLVIGPIETGDPVAKALIFTLTKQREPTMTISSTATSTRPIWRDDGAYPIGDPEYLKRLILEQYKDSSELAGTILKAAECARGHFAKRIEELSQ